jgi:hypothetical protein
MLAFSLFSFQSIIYVIFFVTTGASNLKHTEAKLWAMNMSVTSLGKNTLHLCHVRMSYQARRLLRGGAGSASMGQRWLMLIGKMGKRKLFLLRGLGKTLYGKSHGSKWMGPKQSSSGQNYRTRWGSGWKITNRYQRKASRD